MSLSHEKRRDRAVGSTDLESVVLGEISQTQTMPCEFTSMWYFKKTPNRNQTREEQTGGRWPPEWRGLTGTSLQLQSKSWGCKVQRTVDDGTSCGTRSLRGSLW